MALSAGYTRYLMKSALGIGRDFRILEPETENQLFFVDGKIGVRPSAEVHDADGKILYTLKGNFLGIPKRMTISDANGDEVAWLKAKAFSIVKDRMDLEVANGEPWHLEGSFLEKNYTVSSGDRHIVQITQKFVTVRDTYTIDIADDVSPGLAFAIVWAVDRWVERD